MYSTSQITTKATPHSSVARKVQATRDQRCFCPSIFCFTDEIVVRRVSPQAKVWLLTDEHEDASWMMVGGEPTCPHCGTLLLAVDGRR